MADAVRQFVNDFWPAPAIFEMIRVFPDALFWGIGIIALVTLSFPFTVFFGSAIEGLGLYYFLKAANNYLGIIDTAPGIGVSQRACKDSSVGTTFQTVSVFGDPSKLPFPSSHTFMLSFIASYILSVIVTFKDHLEIMGTTYGESYTTKIYISLISFTTMMFIAMTYRLFNNCDSFTVILISFIIGTACGTAVLHQNLGLFGLEGVNLLGIPILRKRTATGNELMVCSSSSS